MQDKIHEVTPQPLLLWPLVILGILSISVASILIRLAEAPSLSIASYRVGLATFFIAPYFFFSNHAKRTAWSPRTVRFTLLSGVFLAFHFVFWIHSLKLTSVASSVTLVSTTPLFAAIFSFLWLHEKPSGGIVWGILLTFAGSVFIAGTDFSLSRQALQGDLLAILGALMATGYLMAGRLVRASLGLGAYIFCVYGVAALVLLICCYVTDTPLLGFSSETYLILLLLAVVPQLIGHTTFNWALKFLSATAVSVLILGEPIGATMMAFLFLGETASAVKTAGLLILGAGILTCSLTVTPGRDRRGA